MARLQYDSNARWKTYGFVQGTVQASGTIEDNDRRITSYNVCYTKLLRVSVVGGGAAVAGGQLEYIIRVNNIGSLPATRVVVTDDLNPPLGNQVTYVDGSGTLNGATAGVVYSGGELRADYVAQYGGDLQPGGVAVVSFRVQINPALAIGTTITNTGVVSWNDPPQRNNFV